ncbi:MAG: hypothetical protein E7215_17265 [Clostridium sulfidigenes]|uniref:Uncharacterized protein n=1 Tax=Clostridium sulfidigenes TaxID=318464 RepID=A0A927ZR15_9CLOT|nr:hypothetical protein [Clostridium sulfidigenes]
MDYMFMTRPFWLEMSIPQGVVQNKYYEYFGDKALVLDNRREAINFLSRVIAKMQSQMTDYMKGNNVCYLIKDLYKILDEVFHFYIRQKEARNEMCKINLQNTDVVEVFEDNRNKACNVIDSVNLWLENCLLYQDRAENLRETTFDMNNELFVEMYIYGVASQALSLLSMSRKFGERALFTGIKVNPNMDTPLDVIKYHPVIYFNTALTGNQNVLMHDSELSKADEANFGEGFRATYDLTFINSLRIMSTFQADMLHGGKYAMTVIDKSQFISEVNRYSDGLIDGEKFFDAFVLTKEKIQSQVKNNEPIVWIMKANKYRHELRPFICLQNNRVYISYCAMEQAKRLWSSIFLNGGMCYSNSKDELTRAIEKRNEELSDRLVDVLREKLRSHYVPKVDEIDVRYDRIFGEKEADYGDYDILFYEEESKQLFLIEAKFFSDSLNNSGIISDYEKMFKKNGYYEHCRGRYDLVMSEKDKIKKYLGLESSDEVFAHFLFVSSKPLEIEFQDDDQVVAFPCLSIFDKYVEGKLLPEQGDIPVRPIHKL